MAASLISLLGFTIGAILYAMLLWMVLRSRSSSTDSIWPGPDGLSLLTAILGLVWNVGGFLAHGLQALGINRPYSFLLAIAFSALGFLPAGVLHSVIRSRPIPGGTLKRGILWAAYALSLVGMLLHLSSPLYSGEVPSRFALVLLPVGFTALMLVVLISTRRSPGWGQALWIVALAVFAISTLHFINHHGEDPWWLALIGHHASLPLALAFLHQDYRFAFADIFLKRALALILVVTFVFVLYVTTVPLITVLTVGTSGDRLFLILLGTSVATALIYPWILSSAAWFVDNVVLNRPDYDMLIAQASRTLASLDQEEAIVRGLEDLVSPALSARHVRCTAVEERPSDLVNDIVRRTGGSEAVAILPTVDAPHYTLSIGALAGGRRLLSGDIAAIERLALLAARRIDTVRRATEVVAQNAREQEMSRLATEAELRALRAQIHPHFLFNALTTIGYLIETAPRQALDTLLRLSDLLRRALRSAPEFCSLGEELKMVRDYLDIERARFESRLSVRIDVPEELFGLSVPTFILQPLVENAIKHGIGAFLSGIEIEVTAEVSVLAASRFLHIVVRDTGPGALLSRFEENRRTGVGLNNVEKRLRCYAPDAARMTISSSPGNGTRVEIVLPAEDFKDFAASFATVSRVR